MGMFSSECRHCGSLEHNSENCPHGIFSNNKCRHCGSLEHASDDCPHGVFSNNKCRHCGSVNHASDDCPHGVLSNNKCRHCGSLEHASDDCPHGVFSNNKCRHCGSVNHASDDCPHGTWGNKSTGNSSYSSPSYTSSYSGSSSSSSASGSSSDNGCLWLIGIIIVVVIVVWLAINVVFPMLLLNSALIMAILALIQRKTRSWMAYFSFAGIIYMLLDISKGWLSWRFVNKVTGNPVWITGIVWLNSAALGLGMGILLAPWWKRLTEKKQAGESVWLQKSLIVLIILASAILPVLIYTQSENPLRNRNWH